MLNGGEETVRAAPVELDGSKTRMCRRPEVTLQDRLKAIEQVWFICAGQRSEAALLPFSIPWVNFHLGEGRGCETKSLPLLLPAGYDLCFQW